MKSKFLRAVQERPGFFLWWCPGCQCCHFANTVANVPNEPTWSFNGDFESPTFSPSFLVDADKPERRCHTFIENGHIRYLDDCHHGLKGKIVPMERF
jgi:hypothetical protein